MVASTQTKDWLCGASTPVNTLRQVAEKHKNGAGCVHHSRKMAGDAVDS